MAQSQGSLSGGQSSSGLISLPDMKNLYHAIDGDSVRFFITPIVCQIRDPSLLKRIWTDLADIFDSRSLKQLVEGTSCAEAQFMIAFWLWQIRADDFSAEWNLGHEIMQRCITETQRLPEEITTTAPYHIQSYAPFSMDFCCVRVDQNNRSVSSGNMVMNAQFLVITQPSEGAFRVWFREPSEWYREPRTEITARVYTTDLLASELRELNFRVHFTTPTDRPSLDTWPSAETSTKELVWRAIYQKQNNHRAVLHSKSPEPFAIPGNLRYQIPDKSDQQNAQAEFIV